GLRPDPDAVARPRHALRRRRARTDARGGAGRALLARRLLRRLPLRDDPVDLEDLGVLAVHVHAVRARDVPDVLRVRVAAMLLRAFLRGRPALRFHVAALQREVPLVGEVEVVPRVLVAEDRRPLEGAQALARDALVVLVDVVNARLEDGVRPPLLPERDQEL